MATRNFSDLIAEPNTNLTTAAIGDYILIYDASEPLDIYKIKVISIQDVLKLTTETARQPMVTGQAAGDLFYASAAGVLARLAKGTASQVLKMKSDASIPEWVNGWNEFTGARVGITSNQLINTATWTAISYSSAIFDTDGMFSAETPTVLTIQTSGYYHIGHSITWETNSVGVREVHMNVGPSGAKNMLFANAQPTSAGVACSMTGSLLAYLSAGQILDVSVWHNSSASINLIVGRLWAYRVG